MDDALAYERGTAGPRDYRKAAEIYDTLCREGRGDLVACRALLRATYRAHGIAFDHAAAGKLGLAMCERGDPFGCVTAVIFRDNIEISSEQLATATTQLEGSEAHCLSGDAAACEGALLAHGIGAANTAAGGASRLRVLADAACKIGVPDGCSVLAQDAARDGATNDAQRRALAVLSAACDAGDAVACDAMPIRRVDAALLCAAHAYDACWELGCRGDIAAARLARDHGVVTECEGQQ